MSPPGSIEIDAESGRNLKGIARLGAGAPEQMPELRAERFVLVDGADDDLIAFRRNRDGDRLEIFFFLLFGGGFDLATGVDHDLVVVARRDVDRAEIDVDDQSWPPGLAVRVS